MKSYLLALLVLLAACSKHIDEPTKTIPTTTGGVELIQTGRTVRITAYIAAPLSNRYFYNIALHWASYPTTGVFVIIPTGSTHIVVLSPVHGQLVSWEIVGQGNYWQ